MSLVLTMKCGSRHQSGELDRFWIIFNQGLMDSMIRLIRMSPDEISSKPSLSKGTKRILKMNFQKSMLLEVVQAILDLWQAILWWGSHIVDLIFKTDQSNMLFIHGPRLTGPLAGLKGGLFLYRDFWQYTFFHIFLVFKILSWEIFHFKNIWRFAWSNDYNSLWSLQRIQWWFNINWQCWFVQNCKGTTIGIILNKILKSIA